MKISKLVTLKQLRGFTAVTKNGTIVEAARELYLTPAAVSLQLRDLEDITGVPLLEKESRRLRPTLAGKAILQLALKVEEAIIECSQTLDKITGVDHGEASVGVVSTARYFAPEILAVFNRSHPNIKLKLVVGNRQLIMDKLENMDVDFAVTGLPPSHFKVTKNCIGNHPQVIVAHPKHDLAGCSKTSLSRLKNETILLREPGSGTRSMTEKLFKKFKFTPGSIMEFGSNETIKQAVMAGMGVAIISAHTIAAEVTANRLVILSVTGLPIIRKWYVVKNDRKYLLPSAQTLWDYLSRFGEGFLPNIPTGST